MWKEIFLAVVSSCAGFFAAGGVFTVLIAVGLIPRFAGKTDTAGKVVLYENFVVAGTITGCIISIFTKNCQLGDFLLKNGFVSEPVWSAAGNLILLISGVFSGIFVGCLAISIAEMLNTIPIFARRIGFRHGIGVAILFMALGKLAGSLIYFLEGVYRYGGR